MKLKYFHILGALAAGILGFQVSKTMGEAPSPERMIRIPGGAFLRGCASCNLPDAAPVHLVKLSPFWISETPVTNAQFQLFVEKAGYKTVAERELDAEKYPGVPKDKLQAGSAVFTPPANPV